MTKSKKVVEGKIKKAVKKVVKKSTKSKKVIAKSLYQKEAPYKGHTLRQVVSYEFTSKGMEKETPKSYIVNTPSDTQMGLDMEEMKKVPSLNYRFILKECGDEVSTVVVSAPNIKEALTQLSIIVKRATILSAWHLGADKEWAKIDLSKVAF